MTTAVFYESNGTYQIDIVGHAGYSSTGADIVCAACSVLTCTLVQCLCAEQAAGNIDELKTETYSGDVRIKVTPKQDHYDKITQIIDTVATGFYMLADQYPKNVRTSTETGEK